MDQESGSIITFDLRTNPTGDALFARRKEEINEMADPEVLRIFDGLKKLHEQKDADYAGGEPLSNFRRCEAFGIPAWKGCLIRLSDKYSRLVSLVGKGGQHEVPGEGIEDTLRDLAVYSIITLALRKQPEMIHGGERVKREPDLLVGKRAVSNIGSSWDEAKREAVDKPTIDDNDDSVIKTQDECARRFSHCVNCD